ncbi:MAG: hypothetical protein ABSF98_15605 [Bryobacteraceae bacterium]
MVFRSLSSLVPKAADLLALDVGKLAVEVLLVHLISYKDQPGNSVYQHGKFCQSNFIAMQDATGYGPLRKEPEYGDKQPAVNQALNEAWNWLERQGILIRDPTQPAPWFSLSRAGEELLKQNGPPQTRQKHPPAGELTLIADSRLAELRTLTPAQFDCRKLIRLCEEINTTYSEKCYFATAMLTRGLLDHVPPLFGKNTFGEVANNYGGGGKSFKDAMHHLENAARNVADAHLHMPIRTSETLPTAQQVHFPPQLDVLLAEIVRITK